MLSITVDAVIVALMPLNLSATMQRLNFFFCFFAFCFISRRQSCSSKVISVETQPQNPNHVKSVYYMARPLSMLKLHITIF